MKTFTVVYAGLETKTLELFAYDTAFEVVGCGSISYLESKTYNPINVLFRHIYKTQELPLKEISFTKKILIEIACLLRKLTTGYYKKFSEHVLFVGKNNLKVIPITKSGLESVSPDILIVNVWDMVGSSVLSVPTYGTINIHPSKLPQYRGAVPTLMSLKNGDTSTAVSYMLLSKQMDRGGILFQHPIVIDTHETALSLEAKIYKAITETFLLKVKEFVAGTLVPQQQDEAEASYTPKHEEYRLIRPDAESAMEILNKIELYPYLEPDIFCYLIVGEKKVHLKRATNCSRDLKGRDYTCSGSTLLIGTQTGTLCARLFIDISVAESLWVLRHID